MDWAWIFLALVVGVSVGLMLGRRLTSSALKQELHLIKVAQGHDRMNFLRAIQRAIGNELMHIDHWRFVDIKSRVVREDERIAALTQVAAAHEFAALCNKYPTYDQFEPFHTRDHVFCSDSIWSREDLEERYLEVAKFIAVQAKIDPSWPSTMILGDDLGHAKKYARRVDDTLLKLRIKMAIREYYLARNDDNRTSFETADYTVTSVPHFAELRYGLYFKDTKEYGLYGSFHGNRDEPYRSYYRTDSHFEHEETLNDLTGARLFAPPFATSN